MEAAESIISQRMIFYIIWMRQLGKNPLYAQKRIVSMRQESRRALWSGRNVRRILVISVPIYPMGISCIMFLQIHWGKMHHGRFGSRI